jgi:hypothetical protein
MNKRDISKVLNKKFNNFLDSITDPVVKALVERNTIITGGCIASMLLGEEVHDFDMYFTNQATVLAVAHYYVDKWMELHPKSCIKPREVIGDDLRVTIKIDSIGVLGEAPAEDAEPEKIDPADKQQYKPVFLSSNAITLSGKVQLIIRFYGDPAEIHTNYDFAHCCNYWTSKAKIVELTMPAMESLLSRQLNYQGSLYPVCSVIRTRKFIKRGWHINAGQYLKMCIQISMLDLTDVNVLEDQLTGVDAAYFNQVIEICKEAVGEDVKAMLDENYLVEVIERVFG